MKEISVAKRIRALQTRFGEKRNFLAKSFEMGTAWSYYKEKRKEKKELKRCVDFYLFKSVILLGFYSEKKNLMFSWHYKTKTNPNC